ncbi:hypothetical protein [uncultured Algimonas sp.]|nr:hypothetical protein [uncultured Algimonas sp.]
MSKSKWSKKIYSNKDLAIMGLIFAFFFHYSVPLVDGVIAGVTEAIAEF